MFYKRLYKTAHCCTVLTCKGTNAAGVFIKLFDSFPLCLVADGCYETDQHATNTAFNEVALPGTNQCAILRLRHNWFPWPRIVFFYVGTPCYLGDGYYSFAGI